MSHIDDVVTGGILPLQHHDRSYELPLRVVKYAARYGGKSAQKKDTTEKGTKGDLLGGILWPHDPGVGNKVATGAGVNPVPAPSAKAKREIPAWGFVFPAVTMEPSRPEGAVLKVRVRPIGDDQLAPDSRFKILDVLTPAPCGAGTPGTLMAVTEEYDQILVFMHGSSQLVAVHFGKPGSAGSLVHDIGPLGAVDNLRKAHLQNLTRVHRNPETCGGNLYGTPGHFGLAIQLDRAVGGQSTGVIAEGIEGTGTGVEQRLAGLGKKKGGPLFTGFNNDKHDHGVNADGESYGAAHIHTGAFFGMDADFDGPIDFSREIKTEYADFGGLDVQGRIVYNPLVPHATPCGNRNGVWQVAVRSAQYPSRDYPVETGGGGGGGTTTGGGLFVGGRGGLLPPNPQVGSRPLPGDPRGIQDPKPADPRPLPDPTNPKDPKPKDPKPQPGPKPNSPLPKPSPLIDLQPQFHKPQKPWYGPVNDPCKRGAMSTLSEYAFPAISYQAANMSRTVPEYLYGRWDSTHAKAQSKVRPTIMRTEAIGRNVKGAPVYTRKAPCPYPGGTSGGVVVDFPPEVGAREYIAGITAGPTESDSGRVACGTFTGWACPEEDGTVTGFVAENFGGVLTIDSVTSNVTDGTATLEIDSGAGTLKFNGSSLSGSPFPYGGNGEDGAALFDGSTTVAGASRSGSTYTLTRSTNYTDATVSSGVTVKTAGHLLQGTGTLLNAGKIERNGGDATSSAGGAAPGGTQGIGAAGATGRTTSGNGVGGSAFTAALGGDGGNSGSTGGGSAGTGGLASSSRPAATTQPLYTTPTAVLNNGRMMTLTAAIDPSGGGSGASGAFEVGAVGRSGSGGASAGNMQIVFETISTASGTIEAKGGNAYDAAGTGDMGGGGGGGGGCIRAVARNYVGWTPGTTVLVTKGLKSNGIGAGTAGADGTDGQILAFTA